MGKDYKAQIYNPWFCMCGTKNEGAPWFILISTQIRTALFFFTLKHKHVVTCVLMEAYKLENIQHHQVHILKSIIKTAQMDGEVDWGLQGVAGRGLSHQAFTGPPNKDLMRFLWTHSPSTRNSIRREAGVQERGFWGGRWFCQQSRVETLRNPQKRNYISFGSLVAGD